MRASKTPTQVRREQIAEAALALLAARHGEEPSIAGIAHRVGVTPSGVYRHFSGKEAILDAALGLVAQRLQENIARARHDRGGPLTRLHGLFMRHAALAAAQPGVPQILLHRGVFGTSAARRRKVAQVMGGYLSALADIIRAGQASGEFRDDLDPTTAALVFAGMILPAVVLREAREGAFDVREHARKVWPALVGALSPVGRKGVRASARAPQEQEAF
jgi:AcrR family transcriptional regulator